MGTPDIAAACLQSIINEKKHNICGVFTREDKPVGRKKIITPPPVKVIAQQNGIKVFQPKTLKDEITQNEIKELNPDIIVVVAYGRILPKQVLDIPLHGAINLHVSLLPKYRGAAPIQWAVINGETKTGVTIMQLNEGLDTGDIISCKEVDIQENETASELLFKVTKIGSSFLCQVLQDIEKGNIAHTKQDDLKATLAPPLEKHMAEIDFTNTANEVHNKVRGMNAWPLAYFIIDTKKIKVLKTEIINLKDNNEKHEPKSVVSIKPLIIACGENAVILHEVVPEGKSAMTGEQWALGKRLKIGDALNCM